MGRSPMKPAKKRPRAEGPTYSRIAHHQLIGFSVGLVERRDEVLSGEERPGVFQLRAASYEFPASCPFGLFERMERWVQKRLRGRGPHGGFGFRWGLSWLLCFWCLPRRTGDRWRGVCCW